MIYIARNYLFTFYEWNLNKRIYYRFLGWLYVSNIHYGAEDLKGLIRILGKKKVVL